jgi:hypothetical protein
LAKALLKLVLESSASEKIRKEQLAEQILPCISNISKSNALKHVVKPPAFCTPPAFDLAVARKPGWRSLHHRKLKAS